MKTELKREDLIAIRPYKKEDEAFIYSSWLHGLYFGNKAFKDISTPANFFSGYRKVIDKIVQSPRTTIQCAVLKDEEDTILGYSVFTPESIHWVFVKPDWRLIGIAKSLVPDTIKIMTHTTDLIQRIAPKGITYPFTL